LPPKATVRRPQLLACLKVRDERAAVAFWRKDDNGLAVRCVLWEEPD